MPDVELTTTHLATGRQRKTTTSDRGSFTLPLMTPGRYRVVAQRDGFAPAEVNDLVLNVGDNVAIRIQMKVATQGETVTVESTGRAVNVDGTQGTIITRELIESAPINGRTLQTLLQLTPGLVLTAASNTPGQFSVNGQRATSNYLTIDGASGNIGADSAGRGIGQAGNGSVQGFAATGGTNNLISVDAIEEFKVATSSYAPELGRASGGQIILASRRGQNDVAGSAFYYFRNDALSARDYFVKYNGTPKPDLRYQNVGGTLGGPITRTRAWFFSSFEYQEVLQPRSFVSQTPSQIIRETAPPVLRRILDTYPTSAERDLGNGWSQLGVTVENPSSLHATSIRADVAISGATIFNRISWSSSDARNTAYGGSGSVAGYSESSVGTITSTGGVNLPLGSRTYLEARLNISRNSVRSSDEAASGFPVDLFLPSDVAPDVARVNLFLSVGTPGNFQIAGRAGGSVQRQVNATAALTQQRGSHLIKLGTDVRLLRPTSLLSGLDLNVQFTDLARFLQGTASSIAATRQQALAPHFTQWSLFLQDRWQPSNRLSLTYGLRWDAELPPSLSEGRSPFILDAPSLMERGTVVTKGLPLWKTDYLGLAPRVNATLALTRSIAFKTGGGTFFDSAHSKAGSVWGTFPFTNQLRVRNTTIGFPLSPALTQPVVAAVPGSSTVYAFPDKLKLPRSYHWTAGLDIQLPLKIGLDARYVGSRGAQFVRPVLFDLSRTQTDVQTVVALTNDGTSKYHALQLQITRRHGEDWALQTAYTFGRSTDNGSNESRDVQPAFVLDPASDYGPSDFDVRHSVSAMATVLLGNIVTRRWTHLSALSSLQLDVAFNGRTGTPFNPLSARDIGYGVYLFRPDVVPNLPFYIDDPAVPGGRRINRAAFVAPSEARQGNLSRNALRNAGVRQLDAALGIEVPLGSRVRMRLRGEVFNVLNWFNPGIPSPLVENALFGVPTSSLANSLGQGGATAGLNPLYQIGGPRTAQVTARLAF